MSKSSKRWCCVVNLLIFQCIQNKYSVEYLHNILKFRLTKVVYSLSLFLALPILLFLVLTLYQNTLSGLWMWGRWLVKLPASSPPLCMTVPSNDSWRMFSGARPKMLSQYFFPYHTVSIFIYCWWGRKCFPHVC